MIMRGPAAALLLLGGLLPASAQSPAEPPPGEMLQSLNMLVAIVQFCDIDVPHDTAMRIAAAGRMLELNLGITRDQADMDYIRLKEIMVANPPDCSLDSQLMQAVEGQLGISR